MRALRRLILFFFVIIIGVPFAIGGIALIKDDTPPEYLEALDLENYDVEEKLYSDFNIFMMQFVTGNKSLTVDEQLVNELIYASFEGFDTEATQYPITNTEILYVDGVWTKFKNKELTTYALVRYRGVSTTLTLSTVVENLDDEVKISLSKVKIGQLPLPKSMFSYLLNHFAQDMLAEYTYGSVDYDELFITIMKSHIQEELEKQLENDIILFDSLVIGEDHFTINCDLNPENQTAVTLQNTIDEFVSIIENDTLVNNITNTLDLTNPVQEAFNEDLLTFSQSLKDGIEDPESFLDDDIEILIELQNSFNEIDEETQQAIIQSFEDSIDDELINDVNEALQNLNIEGFDSISDLMLGGSTPQE